MDRYNSEKEIEKYRTQYLSYSRSKLIAEMAQWKPSSDQHIAAKQLLDEMDNKKHRKILIISILTLIVALLTLVVAVTGFSVKDFLVVLNSDHKKQELKTIVEPEKPTPTKDTSHSSSNSPSNKVPPLNKKQIK